MIATRPDGTGLSVSALKFVTGLLLALACAGCGTRYAEAPEIGEGGPAPMTVGVLLLDGVYNSELTAPLDVFHHTRFHTKPGMRVITIGRTTKTVTSFEGLRISPDCDLATAPALEVLVVPSGEHSMKGDLDDLDLIDWLSTRGSAAKWVMSVCDGAFLLAESGLLRDRECTTFPGDIPAFRKDYPHIPVVEDVSFVVDENTITGVGGARSYDPAFYLVETLFGADVAKGVANGLAVTWQRDAVAHRVSSGPAKATGRPTCYLPGEKIDANVTVQTAAGESVSLASIVASRPGTRGVVLCLMAGADGGDTRKRGGFWCEDTFNDMPLARHLILDYASKGIRFISINCPPVYHEAEFGYAEGAFLTLPADDKRYVKNRAILVARTEGLKATEMHPFEETYYDPRFRLLANPKKGVPSPALGPTPAWQGRFKWYRDTQQYGTPTFWILKPDLTVYGPPFFMNVYESPGRKIRYTAADIRARLDRLLPE